MLDELPDPGEVPVLDWIDKTLISVDPLYQRPLDAERAATIARAFTWRSFGALVVVPAGDGYHVTDGQHRLEAAKLHPKVQHVPAVIVKAEDTQAEAGIFVDINRNRKNVSALELFFAQLTAGDEDALTIQQVCQRAGIRIPKNPGDYKPNDSIAVTAIGALVSKHYAMKARERLDVLTPAGFTPIKASHIQAVDMLLTDPEFASSIAPDDLASAITALGAAAEVDGKRFAATHKVPAWKGLANVWFQKCRKRRTAPAPKSIPENLTPLVRPEIATRAAAVAARTITPHALATQRNVTAAVAGDPPPGRSALDRRRVG
jgi:hypothetical protein